MEKRRAKSRMYCGMWKKYLPVMLLSIAKIQVRGVPDRNETCRHNILGNYQACFVK